MRRRARLVFAAAVTGVTLTMVLLGTWQSAIPFISPAELEPSLEGRRLQVEGIVENIIATGEYLHFQLTDGGSAQVTVVYRYRDQRPLTLESGRLVIVKGLYQDEVLEAQQVSVRAHEDTAHLLEDALDTTQVNKVDQQEARRR